MTIAKTKLEKEHENCQTLNEKLKQSEARCKELSTAANKFAEVETERNDLVKKVRSHKSELSQVKEEAHRSQSEMQEEFTRKIASYERIEIEFQSYKKTVSVKMAQYDQLDEDVYRLRAENEELKLKNERMQKRLADKEMAAAKRLADE